MVVVVVVVVVGGGGMIVFGLYSTVSDVSISTAFNISSDISESCCATYRENAVYVRLEKNLHCSFVVKQIVNLSVVGTVVLVFFAKLIYITKKKITIVFTQCCSVTTQ